jgi:hypothetical protein
LFFIPSSKFYTMDNTKAICMIHLIQGHTLAYQESGRPSGAALEYRGDHDKEQKWMIEAGDEPNMVALKCVANGKYLHAEPKKFGKVGTGDKQWWKILPGGDEGIIRPLGSCRLHVAENPEWFLYNCHERTTSIKPGGTARNEVYMKWWSVCCHVVT